MQSTRLTRRYKGLVMGGGGQFMFYPLKIGGDGKDLSHAERGAQQVFK